jgi:FkbM family methyltransferase
MRGRLLWRAMRARYRDERVELAAIRQAIRADGVAVDVGANRGSYLYWLARWAPRGRVVAFEPQGELATYLRDAAARMNWKNVTVEEKGVSDQPGELEFFVPGGVVTPGASFSRRVADREECSVARKQVVTLDDYFSPETPVCVLKVDVEGLELQVLRGAERLIRESSPLVVFECEGRHLQEGGVRDVLQFLWDRGYDGHFVRNGELAPAGDFEAAVHQREEGERFFARKDYCNNFIFRRSS